MAQQISAALPGRGQSAFVATGLPGQPFDGLEEYPTREEARAFARAMAADGYDARVMEELAFFRAWTDGAPGDDNAGRPPDYGPEQARQDYYDRLADSGAGSQKFGGSPTQRVRRLNFRERP